MAAVGPFGHHEAAGHEWLRARGAVPERHRSPVGVGPVRPVRQAHNRDQLSGNHVATLRVAHGNDYGDG